ncbi:hypothetical protein [Zhongshania sp.]|jgi:hypothetical protein|uniref:hypothetical protein n=1 Tax=Zhongshania sp. TaxID=1971902 RepID=UPI002A803246|nr:hypothetical protein [Zhongshania sp.]
MDKETKNNMELGFAICGPIFVLTYLIFWIGFGHNSPPPNFVGMTGEQLVSEYYGKYQSSISIGMAMSAVIAFLYLFWSCLLSSMMNEQAGEGKSLVYMQLVGGTLTAWVLGFCPAIWLVCATHAYAIPPEMIKVIHSFTWYIYDLTYMITGCQLTGIGLFSILNKKQTMFPAWTGWAAIAVGVIFLPLTLVAFVADGPFAVGGVWNFYIVFGTWGFAFFTPYSYFMIKELLSRRRVLNMTPVSA